MDDGVRASDTDRDRAAAQLQIHFAGGRLTHGELDDRLTLALRAKTVGDLRRALADLPELTRAPQRDASLERGHRRLLAFYPRRYRHVHEEDMLALRVWCQLSRGRTWRGVLALASAGAVLGLPAGLAFAAVNPPLPTSATMVMTAPYVPGGGRSQYRINLPPSSIPAAQRQRLIEQRTSELQGDEALTEAALADSRAVMAAAARALRPTMSVQALHSRVRISSVSDILMWISAQGTTEAQAERAASAVAHSYIAYVSGKDAPGGRILLMRIACQTLNPRRPPESKIISCWMRALAGPPAIVPGPSPLAVVLDTAGPGALSGALIGAISAVGLSRPSRRFRMA
jgi:hypothetical protein